MSLDKPEYRDDPYWQKRRLTPAELLVHDIGLESWRNGSGEILNIQEALSSTLVPEESERDQLKDLLSVTELSQHPIEHQKWSTLLDEFGWLQSLRIQQSKSSDLARSDSRKCRWM